MQGGLSMAQLHVRGSFWRVLVICAFAAFMVLINVLPARAETACNAYATMMMGKYRLYNNLWGQNSGSGWQCMWNVSSSGSTIAWGTNWNWTGQNNSVKSYTSAVLGWHWGGSQANTGLPLQQSSRKNIYTRWNYRLTQHNANALNVAYDIWLHNTANPGPNGTPSDEVMLWLTRSGNIHPVGNKQATLTVEGSTWDLYEGRSNWQVHTFVRTSGTSSVSVNLKAFLNVLVARGTLSNTKYINGIEVGSEVFTGSGQLDTTSYSTDIY
jgi:hypothetical protein